VRNFVVNALTANGVYGFIFPPTLQAILTSHKNNMLHKNTKAAKNSLAASVPGAGLVHNPAQYQAFLMVLLAEFMHGLYQCSGIIRVGKLRNPVPQIEYMAAAVTVAGKDALNLVADYLGV
jgi:hypothetical protein